MQTYQKRLARFSVHGDSIVVEPMIGEPKTLIRGSCRIFHRAGPRHEASHELLIGDGKAEVVVYKAYGLVGLLKEAEKMGQTLGVQVEISAALRQTAQKVGASWSLFLKVVVPIFVGVVAIIVAVSLVLQGTARSGFIKVRCTPPVPLEIPGYGNLPPGDTTIPHDVGEYSILWKDPTTGQSMHKRITVHENQETLFDCSL